MTMTDPADRLSHGGGNHDRPEPVKIWKARKFIEENSVERISLTQVANALRMSATHLSEKFRDKGMNFVDYVARTRFEKARELLQDIDLRISEIVFAGRVSIAIAIQPRFQKINATIADSVSRSGCAAFTTTLSKETRCNRWLIIFRKNAQSTSATPEIRGPVYR
jgi:AraC-like DNA-binding protein